MIYKALTFFVFSSLFKYHSCGELKVKIEDLFIDYVNYTYIDQETFHISIEYESETQSTMDMRVDIIEDIPADVGIKLKVWGRAFGQYTVPTGINMDIKLCQGKLKEFIRPYMIDAGMSDQCPPKKGIYENHGMSTEIIGLPISLLPGLRFLVETESYASNIVMMKIRSYIVVM